MHPFEIIAGISVSSALADIAEREERIITALQESAQTVLVRGLQAQNLRRVILAVGMFSIFEAYIQDTIRSRGGFSGIKQFLHSRGELELAKRFQIFVLAINVLKHGRGRSYEALLEMIGDLPFQMKRPDEETFFLGDLSEVTGLIRVDDEFVLECDRVITDVIRVLYETRNGQPTPES